VPEQSRFCLACGAPVLASASEAATVALHSPSSSSVDEGRFPAGTMLAGRYRILGLIGRGGMGEVYRANDVKVGQLVALKFLPESAARQPAMLARLHAEVRIARQVSHPNVCRVYDIGELDGLPFLTMEYVDGEDLGSLLRRIGRLPGDKAVEIARRLCAGLAAAHDKSVLHRDLKPANIMIDGRGQVIITDFGLAALAGTLKEGDIRSGTPAYMAPEQIAGREVTASSDIYSLGVVVYEMFTGKRAFEDARRPPLASVSSQVKDIDPAVERVIARCMAEDPRGRPASALAVAAALPGGDPLAAALAAGDTPSPAMVAAAGEGERISVRACVLWMVAVLVGLVVVVVLGSKLNPLSSMPSEYSIENLAQKARDLARSLGYTARPTDRAWGLSQDTDYMRYAESHLRPAEYRTQRASGRSPFLYFGYRESPRYLEPANVDDQVYASDPPMGVSGMVALRLDLQGRLTRFLAVPPQLEESAAAPGAPADWKALFAAAGLDIARFSTADPQWVPPDGFDARAAWTGVYPHAPAMPLRIEAASWRGKPIYFDLIGPWSRATRMEPAPRTAGQLFAVWVVYGLILAVFAVAALLAWRNQKLKRGDARSAARLAAFISLSVLLGWATVAHHVPTIGTVYHSYLALSIAIFWGVAYWALYVALEPYVRRRWPRCLVAWTRLLGGSFRDPLVGGHVLAGAAFGAGVAIVNISRNLVLERFGELPAFFFSLPLPADASHTVFRILGLFFWDLGGALGALFLFFLLRAGLRRQWLAVVAFFLLASANGLGNTHPQVAVAFSLLSTALMLLILIRFGLLCLAVTGCISDALYAPLTTDFSAWYSSSTILIVGFVLLVAGYGFYAALAGRPLFREGFLEN